MAFDYDYTGNIALLDLPKVAFFASREVSPEQRRSALRWAEQTIRTGEDGGYTLVTKTDGAVAVLKLAEGEEVR